MIEPLGIQENLEKSSYNMINLNELLKLSLYPRRQKINILTSSAHPMDSLTLF